MDSRKLMAKVVFVSQKQSFGRCSHWAPSKGGKFLMFSRNMVQCHRVVVSQPRSQYPAGPVEMFVELTWS